MKQILFPIIINRKGNKPPVVNEYSVNFEINSELFDYKAILELINILSCFKPIFSSQFSFIPFLSFLMQSKDINPIERECLKSILTDYIEIYNNRVSASDKNSFINKITSIINQNLDTHCNKGLGKELFPFINIQKYINKYCNITEDIKKIDFIALQNKYNVYLDINNIIFVSFLIPILKINKIEFFNELSSLKKLDDEKYDIIREKFNLNLNKKQIDSMLKKDKWVLKELYSSIKDRLKKDILNYFIKFFNTTFELFVRNITDCVDIAYLKKIKNTLYKKENRINVLPTNIYFKKNIKPIVYLNDELISSIYLDSYIKNYNIQENVLNLNEKDREEKNKGIEDEIINNINYLLGVFDGLDIEIRIFSGEGEVYKVIKSKDEFTEYFYKNNYELFYMFKRIKKIGLLKEFLFKSDSKPFLKANLWVMETFISQLYSYMIKHKNYGKYNVFVGNYLNIDIKSGDKFLNILVGNDKIIYPINKEKYKNILVLILKALILSKKKGINWVEYNEDNILFYEQIFIDTLVQKVIVYSGLDTYLKIVVDNFPINIKRINKKIVEEIYFKRYNYFFKSLIDQKDLIIDKILNLY